jgi:hypothetical protein
MTSTAVNYFLILSATGLEAGVDVREDWYYHTECLHEWFGPDTAKACVCGLVSSPQYYSVLGCGGLVAFCSPSSRLNLIFPSGGENGVSCMKYWLRIRDSEFPLVKTFEMGCWLIVRSGRRFQVTTCSISVLICLCRAPLNASHLPVVRGVSTG